MSTFFSAIKESLLQLFYPHVCAGCGSDALTPESQLCVKCIHGLPLTGFEKHAFNPIDRSLAGRVRFINATSQLYFNKESLVQRLMHEFKYRGNKSLGQQLGVMMGVQLQESGRFGNVEALVPLPLYETRLKQRGYNQSAVLCQGIQEVLGLPVIEGAIERPLFTETQTKKNRVERWKNMEGKFRVIDPALVQNRHVLLVDDVITTGATIESCASELVNAGALVSIATLCYASQF